MSIDFSIFIEYLPYLLVGFWLTIKIVAGALLLGLPFGLVLALGRKSNFFIPRFAATSFIEIFRNTPFIIQVFLFYYVLPFYGIRFPAEYVGTVALAAFGSAYFAEVIRGGIDAIPKGQLESAKAIGMSDWQAMRNIIFTSDATNYFTTSHKSNTFFTKRVGNIVHNHSARTHYERHSSSR
jgi:polar amino acid transport system permease protein